MGCTVAEHLYIKSPSMWDMVASLEYYSLSTGCRITPAQLLTTAWNREGGRYFGQRVPTKTLSLNGRATRTRLISPAFVAALLK